MNFLERVVETAEEILQAESRLDTLLERMGGEEEAELEELEKRLCEDVRNGNSYALAILDIINADKADELRKELRNERGKEQKPRQFNSREQRTADVFYFWLPLLPPAETRVEREERVVFRGLRRTLYYKIRNAYRDGYLKSLADIPETPEAFLEQFDGFGFSRMEAEVVIRKTVGIKARREQKKIHWKKGDQYPSNPRGLIVYH